MAAKNDKRQKPGFDLHLLTSIMNPAIFIMLVGGLIVGYNTAVLIAIGVMGYGTCAILNAIDRKQKGVTLFSKGKKG